MIHLLIAPVTTVILGALELASIPIRFATKGSNQAGFNTQIFELNRINLSLSTYLLIIKRIDNVK
jgi:hypothetical protein